VAQGDGQEDDAPRPLDGEVVAVAGGAEALGGLLVGDGVEEVLDVWRRGKSSSRPQAKRGSAAWIGCGARVRRGRSWGEEAVYSATAAARPSAKPVGIPAALAGLFSARRLPTAWRGWPSRNTLPGATKAYGCLTQTQRPASPWSFLTRAPRVRAPARTTRPGQGSIVQPAAPPRSQAGRGRYTG
jgi:hypothetical protein